MTTRAQYQTEWRKEQKKNLDKVILNSVRQAKHRAKNKDIPFDLDEQFILGMIRGQNYKCSLTGRDFNALSDEFRVSPNTPSIDRIIPKLGYTKDNVRIICWHANSAIGEYGLDNFLQLCREVADNNR